MNPRLKEALRALPAVSELLQTDQARSWARSHPRYALVEALRRALDGARSAILGGDTDAVTATADILAAAREHLDRTSTPSLRPVINATGIVLHTGLGRAPLAEAAARAVTEIAAGYGNLEFDLAGGHRGKRTDHVRRLLCELTGAESATVVNNNAAAVLLIMRTFCADREVVVSRGQLVEIGGSFRIPDVIAAGGAVLREVGTTNRTRKSDYLRGINENTAALLRVHPSNYRVVGFTEHVPIEDLVACAHDHGLLAVDDLGSGALIPTTDLGLPTEPDVVESLRAGADLVCFSGDKLLGGPQSGMILGRGDLIARIESHPLMRTYRVDKMVLAALEATLVYYRDPRDARRMIPALSMLTDFTDRLAERARSLEQQLSHHLPDERFFIGSDESYAGGGSLPARSFPTVVVRWQPAAANIADVAARLRLADPPVVARINDNAVCFDMRTVRDAEISHLVAAIEQVASESN